MTLTEDKVSQLALSTEEMAYIAGLFDGEGTVTISSYAAARYGGRRRRILMVLLSSTDRSIVCYLRDSFGGSIFTTNAHDNHKEIHRWTLSSRMAADFLYGILPYIRIKREHAILGLEWQATMKQGTNQYTRISDELLEWQDFYVSQIRQLNVRGNGNNGNNV